MWRFCDSAHSNNLRLSQRSAAKKPQRYVAPCHEPCKFHVQIQLPVVGPTLWVYTVPAWRLGLLVWRSILQFAVSALCLAGLCRSLVTVLPRHPTSPGSNLRHLSAATAGATGCASSPGPASTSRAPCSPSSTRHRCRQPKWYRHRSEPFDER